MARKKKGVPLSDADWGYTPSPESAAADTNEGAKDLRPPSLVPATVEPARHELAVPLPLQEEAKHLIEESLAKNTRTAYASDWRQFTKWCKANGRNPLPANAGTVVGYLTELSRSSPWSTIRRKLSTICHAHQVAKDPRTGEHYDSPGDMIEVRKLCRGIRRTKGTANLLQKKALMRDDVQKIVDTVHDYSTGAYEHIHLRDQAILLLGFAGAFRRSELSGLDVEHVSEDPRGLVVYLARSKTDQEGRGAYIGIPREAERTIATVRAWLAVRRALAANTLRKVNQGNLNVDIFAEKGPLFFAFTGQGEVQLRRLLPAGVGKVVVRALERAGVLKREKRAKGDPRQVRSHGAHSLRAGFATQARRDGRTIDEIMVQARWKSHKQAMSYVRREDVFENNAARGVAL